MLKKFGALTAWLSGSIAGVNAVLYTIGFLATKSADHVLGLGVEITSHDPVFYIRRGGGIIAHVAIISVGPALAVILAIALLRWLGGRMAPATTANWASEGSWPMRLAAPAASLAMIALVLLGLPHVVPDSDLGGLLFATSPGVELCANGPSLELDILTQNRDALESRFNDFAIVVGLVVGIAVSAQSELLDRRKWPWASLSALALFLAMVSLPVAFGALVVKPDYSQVWIAPQIEDDLGRMRLLLRNRDEVVVWLAERREVLWIKADKIDRLIVGHKEPIETVSCDVINAPPRGDRP